MPDDDAAANDAHEDDPDDDVLPTGLCVSLAEPGIFDGIKEADYHRDPCPVPSLSRSVLAKLLSLTPSHAHAIHPRLGGRAAVDRGTEDDAADFGTAAHSSFLQGRSDIVLAPFRDWRTKKAKEMRQQAYADGKIALLQTSYGRAMRLIDVLEHYRARTGAFCRGKAEQTLVWTEGQVWCRARVDWLPDDPSEPLRDLKTTAGFATLNAWTRVAYEKRADLQDVFYGRGAETLRGEDPTPMIFTVVEQKPPFGIREFQMTPIARDLARDDVLVGTSLWENCLAMGLWPSYPAEPEYIWPPTYWMREREGRTGRDPTLGREHPNAVSYIETGNFGG